MQNWDDIRFFLEVARTGSFLAAAERLGVNATTVGRRIDHLEKSLGQTLFDRQRHGMTLTAHGRARIDQANLMDQAMMSWPTGGAETESFDTICVSLPIELDYGWLSQRWPEISPALVTCSLEIDHLENDADTAHIQISPRAVKKEGWHNDFVGRLSYGIYASDQYLASYGNPKDWGDLEGHKFVQYQGFDKRKDLSLWNSRLRESERIAYRTPSFAGYLQALQGGVGLGILPRFYLQRVNDLSLCTLPTEVLTTELHLAIREPCALQKPYSCLKNRLETLLARDQRFWV